MLEEAGDLFAKAGLFDMCVEVSSLQTLVYEYSSCFALVFFFHGDLFFWDRFKTERHYDQLMQCLQRFADMTKKLIEAVRVELAPISSHLISSSKEQRESLPNAVLSCDASRQEV